MTEIMGLGQPPYATFATIRAVPPRGEGGKHMFAPVIKVDFDKLRGEEDAGEQPPVRKAKASPKSRAAAAKPAADNSAKKD